MFSNTVLDSLGILLNAGIEVSMHYDREKKLWYADLNTGAKSHMYLYDDGKIITLEKRYNEKDQLNYEFDNSMEDILNFYCYNFVSCIKGRSFANENWVAFAKERGYTPVFGSY